MCTQSSEIVGLLLGGVVFLARNKNSTLGNYEISHYPIFWCVKERYFGCLDHKTSKIVCDHLPEDRDYNCSSIWCLPHISPSPNTLSECLLWLMELFQWLWKTEAKSRKVPLRHRVCVHVLSSPPCSRLSWNHLCDWKDQNRFFVFSRTLEACLKKLFLSLCSSRNQTRHPSLFLWVLVF